MSGNRDGACRPQPKPAHALGRREEVRHIGLCGTVENPKVTEFMIQQIEPYQKDLAGFERIKRLTLLPHHFSIEKGEVTNTMKVRRAVVARNYAAVINAMYAGTE